MAKRKIFSAEQILMKLREAEVLLAGGKSTKEACRVLEISEQTYYRWRKEYGEENSRLKGLVADLSLDNAILKEVLSKK